MSDVTTPIFGVAGVLAGTFLWLQFIRWMGLLYVAGSKEGGDFLGPPKRRLLWAIPFIALLHPAPWLICIAGICAFRAIRADAGGIGTWFFGGLIIAQLQMIHTTAITLTRWRRLRHSQASGPNKSLERTRGR